MEHKMRSHRVRESSRKTAPCRSAIERLEYAGVSGDPNALTIAWIHYDRIQGNVGKIRGAILPGRSSVGRAPYHAGPCLELRCSQPNGVTRARICHNRADVASKRRG